MAARQSSSRSVLHDGGQVEGLTEALIDAAYDKDAQVRASLCKSLAQVGKRTPKLMLDCCYTYLVKRPKLARGHRVVLLQTMQHVVQEQIDDVDGTLAGKLVQLGSVELTQTKDVVPDWQTASSGLLVALGRRKEYGALVMDELMTKFGAGTVPHFFVVETLGKLASENVYGVVPRVKDALTRMLPVMAGIRHDNLKWAFCSCLAKFCDAILDYIANIEMASDKSITSEMYFGEMYSAYDVMFNLWLVSKEAKLRLAVIDAIGYMSHLMSTDRLEEITPRLIPMLSSLYKKHTDHFYITNSICMCLDAVQKRNPAMLDPYIDVLMNSLHPVTCVPADFANPVTVKNHNELLRCFNVLARSYSDRVVGFLLQKLEVKDERSRIGTLEILKHLVNSSDEEMDTKKSLIVSGLKILLSETNNQVKKMLAQLVTSMAHHEYLSLEGGHLLIEFIVRQCALTSGSDEPKSPVERETVGNLQLRQMCENVLHLITTTIQHTESVLWPYLLECVVPPQYTEAMGSLCRSAAYLASKKRAANADDYELDYEILVNVPKPAEMISRLLVMAGRPHGSGGRGLHVLNLMKDTGPILNEDLVELWDAVIPKLTQYLEEYAKEKEEKEWSQKQWEDLVLKLLSKTLDEVNDEEWTCELGSAMGRQISLYPTAQQEEKNFLYKCLGVVLRKSTSRQFIHDHLNILFSTVDHSSQIEREGCAMALGFCATAHLDSAIEKLEYVAKDDMVRKPTGFLGLMKDKTEAEVERVKSTVMLCYGQVTFFAPPDLITSRIEVNILRSINPHFTNVKDTSVKQNLIRAVDLVGKALHPSHLQTNDFVFQKRSDLLIHMQNYIKAEPTGFVIARETVSLAMDACATLVMLDPQLTEADEFDLIKTCTDAVYRLPRVETLHDDKVTKGKSEATKKEETAGAQRLMNTTVASLNQLLKQILLKRVDPNGLENITKHLEPWIVSVAPHERQLASESFSSLLHCYLDTVQPEAGSSFVNLGNLLARMTPRCTDPELVVRQNAIESMQTLLRISGRYAGISPHSKDQFVDAVSLLKDRAQKDEANALFGVVNDMSKVLSKKLPADQLIPYIYRLLDGLIDAVSHSSSGACVVLNSLFKLRGGELATEVSSLVKEIIEKMTKISSTQTHTGSLRSLRTLAVHHLQTVITTLLDYPIPLNQNVIETWQTLAQDKQLVVNIFDLLLELLSRSLPYAEKDRGSSGPVRHPTPVPKAVTCAFTYTFGVEDVEPLAKEHFHRLFAALLIRIGSCAVITEPAPGKNKLAEPSSVSCAMDAMKELLTLVKAEAFLTTASEEGVWATICTSDRYSEGVTTLAWALCRHAPEEVPKVVNFLTPVLSNLYEPQRVVTAAFFAELIHQQCLGDMNLVELLMNNLLGRLIDSSHYVRMLCVRGLGNIASIGGEQLKKYTTTVLSAMMAGMDDKEDPHDLITLEAMAGLSKIVDEIGESHVRPILINICIRIRPCFEKDKAPVRAAAFTLFGNLKRFGDGPSRAPFLEQIHNNFITLLLHMNEDDKDVVKACKKAIRQIGPLLGSTAVNDMFQKHLIEDAQLHYGEFMNDLARLLIADFPDKINFYTMNCVGFFKSVWQAIRASAAMFAGFLLGNLPKADRNTISKEHVCAALKALLKDASPRVRMMAGEAMSLLYDY